MKRSLLLLLLIFSISSFSYGQETFYRKYSVEDGLVSSTVYDIYQDDAGFIWFGTEAGVSKFDGIRFVNYSKKSGLGDNEIFKITPDKYGRLWFFPFNGRLSYFNVANQRMVNAESDTLLAKLIIKTTFTNLIEDDESHRWFGTQKDRKIGFYANDAAGLLDCPHRNIFLLKADAYDLTYRSGKNTYTMSITWDGPVPSLANPVLIDSSYSTSKATAQLDGYQVTDHFIDNESNHWYSTLGHGVLMKPRSEISLVDKKSGLLFNHVYSLMPYQQKLLIGYQNGRLQQWSANDTNSVMLGKHSYNRIRDIVKDDFLWLATDKALFALNPSDLSVRHQYNGAVKCLKVFKDSIYFGTATGLYCLGRKTPEEPRAIFRQRTISVAVIGYDSILIGTNYGLKRYNGEEVLNFQARISLGMLNGRVKSMLQIGDSSILYATAEGLVYQSPTKTELWTSLSMGISSDVCHQLKKENDSTVWLATNNGLDRIVFKPGSDGPFIDNFSMDDGLLSNYINDIEFDERAIYVATDAGISILPLYVEQKQIAPQAYILDVDINDVDTNIQAHYNLEHFQNKIKITFSSIAFENGKNTKYQYRLVGLSDKWSNTALTELQFEALRPGDYTFQIVALAMDGGSVSKATSISFKISKPYYAEWWFITIMAILGLIIFSLFARLVVKYMSRRGLAQKNKLLEEQNEIIEFEKKRSEDLLLNILPETTANELKEFGKVKARQHSSATVLFSDFKGFTEIAEQLSAEDLVAELDFCFRAYDEIIEKYNLEKIKTIGDAYMCAAGLNPNTSKDPLDMVDAALEIIAFMEKYAVQRELDKRPFFQVRIGIHYGGVVSGVVGHKKFAFDIWGDTVNTAARMESSGVEGKVNISQSTFEAVQNHFDCIARGPIQAKGKGAMEMYFVEKRKADSEPASL
jgi:class 3 adenylate cyclase